MHKKSDSDDNQEQLDELLPEIYADLRRLASSQLHKERNDHTLQTTALVHEAYVRLSQQHLVQWENEKEILQASVVMMRRVLVDYARAKNSLKRKAAGTRIPLENVDVAENATSEIVLLDIALDELKDLDPRQAEIVELRYFGGLTLQEVADHCELSLATVKREWAMAKAWLYRRIYSKMA